MSVKPRAFQGQYPPRWHSIINSPVGRLYVAASDNALTGIWYEEQAHFPLPHELGERITNPAGLVAEADEVAQAIGADAERRGEHIYVAPARILAQTERELDEYFRGRRTDFEVPLDPDGTDFQLAVWDYLKTVPYGYTVTYGEISALVRPPRLLGRQLVIIKSRSLFLATGCSVRVGSSPDTLAALTVNVGYWIVKSLKIHVAGGCFSVMPTNFPPYFSDKDWYI